MKINSRRDLVDLMRHLGLPLTAAEIGVAEGRFSIELLQKGIEKLYLVDIWETVPFIVGMGSQPQHLHDENYSSVLGKIKGHEEKVVLLKGFSYKMCDQIPNESLGLVYIDGDHTYTGARADIYSYWPKLVIGGIMAFHDARNPTYGIMDALYDFTKGLGITLLEEDGHIDNMGAYIIKRGDTYDAS